MNCEHCAAWEEAVRQRDMTIQHMEAELRNRVIDAFLMEAQLLDARQYYSKAQQMREMATFVKELP